jgi:hypothetical protein
MNRFYLILLLEKARSKAPTGHFFIYYIQSNAHTQMSVSTAIGVLPLNSGAG